jgi:hypothetical protein
MTAPTVPVTDFQRDQILTAAIRQSGILMPGKSPKPEQMADAANYFEMVVLNELQSDSIVRKQVERDTVTLTAGTAAYTLDTDAYDIELGPNDFAGTVGLSGTAETQVLACALADYQKIPIKDNESRPSLVYVEKTAPATITFWPVPDAAYTFYYAKVRYLFRSGTGSTTMDLRRMWAAYAVFAVAVGVCFANSKPELANIMKRYADEKKELARSGDAERPNIRFRIGHSGVNWR